MERRERRRAVSSGVLRFFADVDVDMGGERAERRTAIMAVARVAWKDQKGTARELSVKIEDTSRSGACIRISVPISVESKLIVDWRDGRFSGVAKYCRADGDEYSVGIRRDAPEIAAQAKVSTEVTTSAIEQAASESVRDAGSPRANRQDIHHEGRTGRNSDVLRSDPSRSDTWR